jgi:hypothetical protein
VSQRSKIDTKRLEASFQALLAKTQRVLAIMKKVESAEIPEGKTPLDLLAEELEREGLLEEIVDEAT